MSALVNRGEKDVETLPKGPKVVPSWDYLIEF